MRTLALLFIAGCGRIGFDSPAGDGGNGNDNDGLTQPACMEFGAWSTPRKLDALASDDEDWETRLC